MEGCLSRLQRTLFEEVVLLSADVTQRVEESVGLVDPLVGFLSEMGSRVLVLWVVAE